MDGSQKLPQRLLGTIRDRLGADALDRPPRARRRGLDALRDRRRTRRAQPIDVRDPMAVRLRSLADGAADPAGLAQALLGIREIFGDDLPADPRFTQAVVGSLGRLYEAGARRTVAGLA